jgi:phospholipid/cholesterol/gamma-HCH transport system substrate-binding protein
MAAAALLAAVCALAVVVLFSSTRSYTVTADVADASQLVPGDDVKLGAASIGTVQAVRLAPDGDAQIVMSIGSSDWPLRKGTTAAIRENSLAGSANRYIVLAAPPGVSPPIPDGGTIPISDTTSEVDLDALIDAFNPPTRLGLRELIRGGAEQYGNRGAAAARSLQLLAPALYETDDVAAQLIRDEPAYESLLRDGAKATEAIVSQRQDLTDLIGNANTALHAIGTQEESLQSALVLLPGAITRTETTFTALRGALPDLSNFIDASGEDSHGLAPFLDRLTALLRRAYGPVLDLSALIHTPGPANDLTDLMLELPTLARQASTAFPDSISAMNESQTNLNWLRDYTPDIAAAITQLDLATGYYDADGHYARVQPEIDALHYDASLNQLQPEPYADRVDGFQTNRSARCPGGAVQPPPDHSAPYAGADCQLSATPPGP